MSIRTHLISFASRKPGYVSFTGLGLMGLMIAISGCTVQQTGQSFVSGTVGAASPSSQQSVQYSYADGVTVGRQFAERYAVDRQIQFNEPMPRELSGTNLGIQFETGCRQGINLYVRENELKRLSVKENVATGEGGQDKTLVVDPNSTTLESETGDFPRVIHPELSQETNRSRIVIKSVTPLQKEAGRKEKSLGKNIPGNKTSLGSALVRNAKDRSNQDNTPEIVGNSYADAESLAAAEQLFADSTQVHSAEPTVETVTLQSLAVPSSEFDELANPDQPAANESGTTEPKTTDQPKLNQELHGDSTEQMNPLNQERSFSMMELRSTRPRSKSEKMLILTARTQTEPMVEASNKKNVSSNGRAVRLANSNGDMIRLTAIPRQETDRIARTPTLSKFRPQSEELEVPIEVSVLVEQLDGVSEILEPVVSESLEDAEPLSDLPPTAETPTQQYR